MPMNRFVRGECLAGRRTLWHWPLTVTCRCERIGIRCTAKQTKSLRKPRLIKPLNKYASPSHPIATLLSNVDIAGLHLWRNASTLSHQPLRRKMRWPVAGNMPREDLQAHPAATATRHTRPPHKPNRPRKSFRPRLCLRDSLSHRTLRVSPLWASPGNRLRTSCLDLKRI